MRFGSVFIVTYTGTIENHYQTVKVFAESINHAIAHIQKWKGAAHIRSVHEDVESVESE